MLTVILTNHINISIMKFLEIEDRMSGDIYTHYNHFENLLLKVEIPRLKNENDFQIFYHDIKSVGFSLFMPKESNSYCYCLYRGAYVPTKRQLDYFINNKIKTVFIDDNYLKSNGYDVFIN
jgi:hypothetical protein